MVVELERTGSFNCKRGSSNPGRCGKDDLADFTYKVILRCRSENLDNNDFVTDHFDIPKYFKETFENEAIVLSCEMIAMRAVMHFYSKLKPRMEYISVNIVAENVSHRAVWDGTIKGALPPGMPESRGQMSTITEKWTGSSAA